MFLFEIPEASWDLSLPREETGGQDSRTTFFPRGIGVEHVLHVLTEEYFSVFFSQNGQARHF